MGCISGCISVGGGGIPGHRQKLGTGQQIAGIARPSCEAFGHEVGDSPGSGASRFRRHAMDRVGGGAVAQLFQTMRHEECRLVAEIHRGEGKGAAVGSIVAGGDGRMVDMEHGDRPRIGQQGARIDAAFRQGLHRFDKHTVHAPIQGIGNKAFLHAAFRCRNSRGDGLLADGSRGVGFVPDSLVFRQAMLQTAAHRATAQTDFAHIAQDGLFVDHVRNIGIDTEAEVLGPGATPEILVGPHVVQAADLHGDFTEDLLGEGLGRTGADAKPATIAKRARRNERRRFEGSIRDDGDKTISGAVFRAHGQAIVPQVGQTRRHGGINVTHVRREGRFHILVGTVTPDVAGADRDGTVTGGFEETGHGVADDVKLIIHQHLVAVTPLVVGRGFPAHFDHAVGVMQAANENCFRGRHDAFGAHQDGAVVPAVDGTHPNEVSPHAESPRLRFRGQQCVHGSFLSCLSSSDWSMIHTRPSCSAALRKTSIRHAARAAWLRNSGK